MSKTPHVIARSFFLLSPLRGEEHFSSVDQVEASISITHSINKGNGN